MPDITQIEYICIFLVVVYLFRIIGIALLYLFSIKHPQINYSISGIVGLVAVSFTTWILNHSIDHEIAIPIFLIYLLVSVFIFLFKRLLFKNLRIIILKIYPIDIVFLVFFVYGLILRSIVPEINVIEDFMDLALINNLSITTRMPPMDVWYSGSTINYYYFGHYLVAIINKISGIPNPVLYNLFFAYIVGISSSLSYSISYYISKQRSVSIITPVFLIFGGNFDYIIKVLNKTADHYFYPEARSLVENVITEFASYSFLLGNLHAHILNIPIVFSVILLAIYTYRTKIKYRSLVVSGLLIGVVGLVNTWDMIIYLPFFCILVLLKSQVDLRQKLIQLIVIAVTCGLTFFPFYLNFNAPVNGVGLIKSMIPLNIIFTMFGLFIAGFILFFSTQDIKKVNRIVVFLFIFGFIIILIPQIIYIKDIYDLTNPPYYRANTVFKFWFQAWIILTLTIAPTIVNLLHQVNLKKKIQSSIAIPALLFFTILIISSLAYGFNGLKTKTENKLDPRNFTLYGDEYLYRQNDNRIYMVDWLNDFGNSSYALVEAPGDAYTSDSLVSSYSGIPTVIGWINHEFGWRNNWPELSKRIQEIETIYTSQDSSEVNKLLKKHNIKYIVLSQNERNKYGINLGDAFIKISEPVVIVGQDELRVVN